MRNVATFILTYGRPHNIITLKTLKRCGFTGKTYLVVSDDDKCLNEYKDLYGDSVFVFHKEDILVDTMDCGGNNKVVVFARNYVQQLAKELGLTHYVVLDDDYTSFEHRYINGDKCKVLIVDKMDEIYNIYFDYLDNTNITCLAFAQGGDLIGGAKGQMMRQKVKRKAMNAFFCRTDRPFEFMGRINEDAVMAAVLGSRGQLFLTVKDISLTQKATQSNNGGLTDIYLDYGTYIKSFYSVMANPSSVCIHAMQTTHTRLHHKIDAKHTYPYILSENFKKY